MCAGALLFTFCLVCWFFSSFWVEAGTKQRHQRELFDLLFVGWGHTFKHTHTLELVSTEKMNKCSRLHDVIHLFSCSDQSMWWLVHVNIISYYNSVVQTMHSTCQGHLLAVCVTPHKGWTSILRVCQTWRERRVRSEWTWWNAAASWRQVVK